MPRQSRLVRLVMAGTFVTLIAALPAAAQTPTPAEERAVRDTVEDFLLRLGNRQVETLADDFTDHALLIVSRERDGTFSNSTQPVADWLERMRSNTGGQPFREPISNVTITVDSGTLAYLRADFEVVRDGQTLSAGVDQFTLVREADGWKIAVVAYTSIPRP